jgi:hypothetical protein
LAKDHDKSHNQQAEDNQLHNLMVLAYVNAKLYRSKIDMNNIMI